MHLLKQHISCCSFSPVTDIYQDYSPQRDVTTNQCKSKMKLCDWPYLLANGPSVCKSRHSPAVQGSVQGLTIVSPELTETWTGQELLNWPVLVTQSHIFGMSACVCTLWKQHTQQLQSYGLDSFIEGESSFTYSAISKYWDICGQVDR